MPWLLIYNITLPFLTIIFLAAALFDPRGRGWLKGHASWMFLAERLGICGANAKTEFWIHAASVGEIRALGRLIQIAHNQEDKLNIHLTCMTHSGLEFAKESLMKQGLIASVSLAPFDWRPCVWGFLRQMKSLRLLAVMETELWPNLITQAKNKGIRLIWINARMSSKTLRWASLFHGLAKQIFFSFDHIACATDAIAKTLMEFGVENRKISIPGNLKWDLDFSVPLVGRFTDWRNKVGWQATDFVWTAGSIREGEEEIILEVFGRLFSQYQNLKLILAPRHLEQVFRLEQLLNDRNAAYALYSRIAEGGKQCSVLVIDKLGALLDCYEASSFVFIGGSLVPQVGGHNFLEPAALAKPIVMGPYFKNFQEIGELFISRQALILVRTSQDLFNTLKGWLDDFSSAEALGLRAREVLISHQGTSQKTWQTLAPFLRF